MLEKIDLTKKMDKKTYKERMEELEPRMALLQRELKSKGVPVMIVFEGFGAAGKGTQINRLIQTLDPRGFTVYSTDAETKEERLHPFLWRFWTKTPEKGRIAVFDRSWYRKLLVDRFEKKTPQEEVPTILEDINIFEKQLTDGGTLIIKFFLDISKHEQKKRFKKLRDNKATKWRVTEEDLDRNKHFGDYFRMADEMLIKTDNEYAPWTVIEAEDDNFATVKILSKTVHLTMRTGTRAYSKGQTFPKSLTGKNMTGDCLNYKKSSGFSTASFMPGEFPWCLPLKDGMQEGKAERLKGLPGRLTRGGTP